MLFGSTEALFKFRVTTTYTVDVLLDIKNAFVSLLALLYSPYFN